jgi:lipopolysaccharide biosynthesis glycosyltransferase
MNYKGLALYIDGDMIVRDDIAKLFDLHEWGKALSVVKHDYKTKAKDKYLNNKNEDYPRKNWSSVILFDCQHFKNRYLTTKYIEKNDGATLHRFKWLKDDEIGELPHEWNWLPDEYGPNPEAKLLHWTLGTPCFAQYRDTPQSSIWFEERHLTMTCDQ